MGDRRSPIDRRQPLLHQPARQTGYSLPSRSRSARAVTTRYQGAPAASLTGQLAPDLLPWPSLAAEVLLPGLLGTGALVGRGRLVVSRGAGQDEEQRVGERLEGSARVI